LHVLISSLRRPPTALGTGLRTHARRFGRIRIGRRCICREKVLCVGMNYVDHCTEQNLPIPKEPVIFK
jgi:2-keto-4-pentenoate hydratase/2-oxohepta-3-ene-1,7-dioic acid hydratase in catechol pathway